MAIAFVQSVTESDGQATTGFQAINGYASNTGGNMLIAGISLGGSGTATAATSLSDTAGNTWLKAVSQQFTGSNGNEVSIWYVKNCASSAGSNKVTVNFSGGANAFYAVFLLEYSGQDSVNTLSASPSSSSSFDNSGSSTAMDPTALLPGTQPACYIALAGENDVATTITDPGGSWNSRLSTPNNGNFDSSIIDQLNSSGSLNPTLTLGSAGNWGAVMAAFAPSTGVVLMPQICL